MQSSPSSSGTSQPQPKTGNVGQDGDEPSKSEAQAKVETEEEIDEPDDAGLMKHCQEIQHYYKEQSGQTRDIKDCMKIYSHCRDIQQYYKEQSGETLDIKECMKIYSHSQEQMRRVLDKASYATVIDQFGNVTHKAPTDSRPLSGTEDTIEGPDGDRRLPKDEERTHKEVDMLKNMLQRNFDNKNKSS